MRDALKNLALVCASLLIGAALVEAALRVAGVNHPDSAFRRLYHEAFLFQWIAERPRQRSQPQPFSALTGWSDFHLARQGDTFLLEDVAATGWRPPVERFAIPKTKRRIVLIGDSFLYGWHLSASETAEHYLKRELEPEFEIVNLATRGFGIGQMALVATKIAPQLEPDMIIVGFITDDLRRSCQEYPYPTYFSTPAPKFSVINGELIAPQAALTPMELWEHNQTLRNRLRNAVLGTMYRSRVVNIAMEPFLRWSWQACLTDLNVALLDLIHRQERTSITIYHLDGEPPEQLLREACARGITIQSMTRLIGRSVTPGEHPDAALNKLYAHEMARRVRAVLPRFGVTTHTPTAPSNSCTSDQDQRAESR